MLRRVVIVMLLLTLPLQAVWAGVAPICAHETQAALERHFGHHEHRHQADATAAAAPAADDDARGAAPGGYHADCGGCHLGAGAALLSPPLVAATLPPADAIRAEDGGDFRSHVPSGPERPDRT